MTETNFEPREAVNAATQATQRATQQVREFGEQAAATGRGYGHLTLDTYERAVESLVEFEHKAAEAAPVDWLKAAIDAHASFVKDVNAAYVKAARGALN